LRLLLRLDRSAGTLSRIRGNPAKVERTAKERAEHLVADARGRYERSWLQDLVAMAKTLDAFNWTTIFGAELLWSVLPLLILLSSLANERIDDDLSRHIGLNSQGAHIVTRLFRGHPTFELLSILTGFLFSFAGTMAVVRSVQEIYERAFGQESLGWRNATRMFTWVAVLLGALILQGAIEKPVRSVAGAVGDGVLSLVAATLFFWWTMHFLLAGRVPWRSLVRPAVVTGAFWLVLAIFSSLYFSSVITSDSKEYGTIGVVFTLLTWFILVGMVIALGAICGAVWEHRTSGRSVAERSG
jgi:membrane protein